MKIGDYIRTKYGIAKYISDKVTRITIYRVIDKDIVYDNIEGWEDVLSNNEIIKSSPNIIDLIEVGDYVNGKKVGFINDSDYYDDIFLSESWDKPFETMIVANYKDIKSIVTHEQFKSIEYEVK